MHHSPFLSRIATAGLVLAALAEGSRIMVDRVSVLSRQSPSIIPVRPR